MTDAPIPTPDPDPDPNPDPEVKNGIVNEDGELYYYVNGVTFSYTHLSFTLSVLLHIFEIKDYQAVIVYSNPPVLPIAAILANRLFKTKIIFVSYDVYPEVAYASGLSLIHIFPQCGLFSSFFSDVFFSIGIKR